MRNLVSRKAVAFAQLGASLTAIAAASGVIFPTAALAQTSQSTLRGRAPAGAEIVATAVDTGSVRRTTAGSDGTYVLAGLQPGNYRVTSGTNTVDVVLAVSSTSVLNLDAPAAAAAEAPAGGDIVVTGRPPTVENKTSQVNQIVTLHDIAALPQSTRNFLEFADTVPGMQFTKQQGGTTAIRGGAQLNSAGNIYIDGVSQKDYVGSGGGTSGSGSGFTGSGGSNGSGSPGNPFPQLAVGEYKVVTSNYSAEYGDASSAIILAQTKSGTNEFHGEAFGTYTNEKLRKKRPDEINAMLPKPKLPSKEYGAAIGGPIVKDIAHFFFTWEHKSLANNQSVFADGNVPASIVALLPAEIASQFGPVTNPFRENLYFGKIDLEPTDRDRFEVTGNFRLERNFSGAGGQNAASTQVPYENNVKRGDARWQHNGEHWVNQFRASYQDAKSAAQAQEPSPQFDYVYFPNDPNDPVTSNANPAGIINIGGPGAGVGTINRQKGWTFADDLTFTDLHFAGDHTLKVGGTFSSIKLTTQNASDDVANATYFYAVTADGVASTPYRLQFPNLVEGFTTGRVETRDKQYGLYIQDNWSVTPELELNLGLRWDREEIPAFLNYVTPANVVAALNGPYCTGAYRPDTFTPPLAPCTTTKTYAEVLATDAPGAPAIDINDYISTGRNRKARNNFSPRIGFSYDFHADGRLVIFGGYSRAYNRNLFSQLALETTKVALNSNPEIGFPSPQTPAPFGQCRTNADVQPDHANHCYVWDPSYLTPEGLATLQTSPSSREVDLINNNIKTPYSDQFSLGIRSRLGDWNTQATMSYVASYDNIYGRWGARYQDGQFYQNGIQWAAQGVPGVGSLILFDNGFKDRNFQLSLAAQKPYTKASGWSATVSYTFSAGKQNNAYAYGAGGNTYLFDYPVAGDYPLLESSSVPRHRVVATATADLPWGFTGAAKLSLATSQPATAIFGCNQYAASCFAATDSGGNPIYVNSLGGGTGGVVSLKPRQYIGFKDIDLQLSKNFTFFDRLTAYGRVDVINVFNWHNYDPTAIQITNRMLNGVNTGIPVRANYNKTTGPIVGDPFTVRLSAGIRF